MATSEKSFVATSAVGVSGEDQGEEKSKKNIFKLKFKHNPNQLFDEHGNLKVSKKFMLDGYNIAIIPDFLNVIGSQVSHEQIWQDITGLDVHDDAKDLIFSDGSNPKLLRGTHPSLHYRGNPVARHKVWLQTDYESGLKRYGYTGWQWRVSLAQCRIESMPNIAKITEDMNGQMPIDKKLNHCIATIYEDNQDNIGMHSDKMRDFNENTGFIVLKLGEARRFQFARSDDGVIFFDETVPAGTAVLVGGDANIQTKHAVPRDSNCKGKSGSIVWRSIAKSIPWAKVLSNIKNSNYKSGELTLDDDEEDDGENAEG